MAEDTNTMSRSLRQGRNNRSMRQLLPFPVRAKHGQLPETRCHERLHAYGVHAASRRGSAASGSGAADTNVHGSKIARNRRKLVGRQVHRLHGSERAGRAHHDPNVQARQQSNTAV